MRAASNVDYKAEIEPKCTDEHKDWTKATVNDNHLDSHSARTHAHTNEWMNGVNVKIHTCETKINTQKHISQRGANTEHNAVPTAFFKCFSTFRRLLLAMYFVAWF